MKRMEGRNESAAAVASGWSRWLERAVERLSPSIDLGGFSLSEEELREELSYGRPDATWS